MTDEGIPRSGVCRLTPMQVRMQMIRNGWSVLPISRHDGSGKRAGKGPVSPGWQRFAQYDAQPPRLAELLLWNRQSSKQPGTGIPCGNAVGVDIDFASDPNLADELRRITVETLGATPFVRQGQVIRPQWSGPS